MYAVSIFDIDVELIRNKNINNMIIDIDNTLSSWGSISPDPSVCSWINNVKECGFNICILSNSSNKRIRKYCSGIDVVFVENVHKPLKSSFIKAMKLLGSSKDNTCVIGDQIFTDIIGGNSCGLFTILVDPVDKRELFFTKLVRKLQNKILKKHHEAQV
jgi:HAD superfamily phosphatase (TIGR01668 family)